MTDEQKKMIGGSDEIFIERKISAEELQGFGLKIAVDFTGECAKKFAEGGHHEFEGDCVIMAIAKEIDGKGSNDLAEDESALATQVAILGNVSTEKLVKIYVEMVDSLGKHLDIQDLRILAIMIHMRINEIIKSKEAEHPNKPMSFMEFLQSQMNPECKGRNFER